MLKKLLKLLWIICCIYILWSLLLKIWLKDPIFKREFIIYNHSLNVININTSSKTEVFDEWIISSSWSRNLLFIDTERSSNKKENFLLKKNSEIVLDSKQINFKQLSKDETLKTSSWVLITWNGWLTNTKKIFFPFYIAQPIYIYLYNIGRLCRKITS